MQAELNQELDLPIAKSPLPQPSAMHSAFQVRGWSAPATFWLCGPGPAPHPRMLDLSEAL